MRLIALFLIVASFSQAAITVIQARPASNYAGGNQCASSGQVNSQTCTFSATPTPGNQILVFVGAGNTITVTDNQIPPNTYTQIAYHYTSSSVTSAGFYLATVNTASGSFVVTATTSNAWMTINMVELSNAGIQDGTGSGAHTTTSPVNCGSVTTTVDNSAVFAGLNTNNATNGITPFTGYTTISNNPSSFTHNSSVQMHIEATAGTFSPTFTTTSTPGQTECAIAALKDLTIISVPKKRKAVR